MARTERLAQLLENLVRHFDLEEFRTLCFDLGVNYDTRGGEGKKAKARELVSYLGRRGRVRRLIELCNRLRPNIVCQEILQTVETEPPFKGLDYVDVARH